VQIKTNKGPLEPKIVLGNPRVRRSSSTNSGSDLTTAGSSKPQSRANSVSSLTRSRKSEDKASQCSTLTSEVRRRSSGYSGSGGSFQHEQNKNANGVSSVEEDICIYRLPGEKLGLGLRFDGGSRASEFVNRLFVQCCSKGMF
jgi:hypothetical protein